MTKDQFKKELSIIGGQFDFYTEKHEGMIGISPGQVVIWVDAAGFSEAASENSEPKNIGEFKSVNELLQVFKVDGDYFADSVLPEIPKLNQIFA